MPYFHFSFRTHFIVIAAMFAMVAFPIAAQSAEWRECEKAKLRELKLQQSATASKSTKSKKHNQESRSERIEEIDTWLWKNCREYSYELRQLEQDRM